MENQKFGFHAVMQHETLKLWSNYEPAVGKYLTIGPRDKAGSDCPCNKLKSLTSVFSSWRDDCEWDRMEFDFDSCSKPI
jgi:hypothetical protein